MPARIADRRREQHPDSTAPASRVRLYATYEIDIANHVELGRSRSVGTTLP